MGTLSQCSAVANSLQEDYRKKIVVPRRGLARLFQKPLYKRNEVAPDVIVSCGSASEPHVLKMKAAYNGRPLAVHLQPPKIDGYDMVFVSRHDWLKEFDTRPHFHQMVGVPHRFSFEGWKKLRGPARARYAPNDERIVVVLVGGTNGAYAYDQASLIAIIHAITDQVQAGWKALVSVSRRTDPETRQALKALHSEKTIVWDGDGDNPYMDYLAAADAFLIAKDSVTMPCEALSTGKPVYSLGLSKIAGRKFDKFERFHDDMQKTLGLTRPYLGSLDPYDYTPPFETRRIVDFIRREKSRGADQD
ncbi:mitochondrial fission ELM1 family protein [Falsirhodobacter sp. 1013]|uniref:mitochondrial fission ELM1 family protein n=1 Tax=Falsirhodobacter sp. 1013 TaxID=3417566 RepID=UPI003EBF8DAB